MRKIKEKFVVDRSGKRVSVLLETEDYESILRDLEELEEIKAYDRAKNAPDKVVSFEKAVSEIERERTKRRETRGKHAHSGN